ncbi:hypothetical protein Plec18167_008005 [Paecilomyces lecythidis]|uniref:FCP1 homology domain-containing protein n=1 Tax=Paecilomyces lecythidis TaxID=3004212 RepID=A0ABR3WZF7_9EURO
MYTNARPKQQSPASHYSTQRVEHAHPEKRQKRRPGNSQAMNGGQARGHTDVQNLSGFTNIESGQEDEVNNYRGCWRPFRDRWKPVSATGAQSYQPQNHASESAAAYQYFATDKQQQTQHEHDVSMDDGDQTHSSFLPYQPSLDPSNAVPDQQAHQQYTGLLGLSPGDAHQSSPLYDVNTGIPNSHWSPLPGQLNASNPYAPPFQQQSHSQQHQQQQQLQLHQPPSVPYGLGYNIFGGPPLGNVPVGFDPVALTSAAASMDSFGQQNEMNSHQPEILPPTRYIRPNAPAGADTSRSSLAKSNGRGAAPQQPKGPRPLAVPVPTKEYMEQASRLPRRLASAQPLLIILDLNGTLIYRRHRRLPPSFAKRPGLDAFLTSIFAKHKVMIWTSSQPVTLRAVCAQLFPNWMRSALVAEWGRDKFGLTQSQYKEKIQVYKVLDKVWGDKSIQAKYPKGVPLILKGDGDEPDTPIHKTRWDQTNTVLVDDSKLKAAGQPYNILEIPEFTSDPLVDETHTLDVVLRKLEILAQYEDVSQMFRHWETRRQEEDTGNPSVENYIIDQEDSVEINYNEDNVSDVSDGPNADDTPTVLVDGVSTEKDQRKKARKEERKAAAALRKRERKAAAKAAKKVEEQAAEQQPKQKPAKKKNKKKKKNAKGTNNASNNTNPIPAVDALCDGAASPAPSSSSENFLLDRLEESLTVSPTKVDDPQR